MNRREVIRGAIRVCLLAGGFFFHQAYAADLVWSPSGTAAEDWTWGIVTPEAWMNGEVRSGFTEGDSVSFTSDEANVFGPRTVAVSGTLHPASLLFSGGGAYTFSGGALELATGLTLDGSGTVTLNTPLTTPRTVLNSGTLLLPGDFDAGDFSAPGGTVTLGSSGNPVFTFSSPEGAANTIQCNWNKGSGSGISLRKKGTGTATLNVRNLAPALGDSGVIYVDEGRVVAGGYGWGSYCRRIVFDIGPGAVLSSGGSHGMGDYRAGLQVIIRPGGTFDPGHEQYISEANPGLWLKGNAVARGDLRNENKLYVKAEGEGNLITNIKSAYGNELYLNVLDGGELHVGELQINLKTIKEGPGRVTVGNWTSLSDASRFQIQAGILAATNTFTSVNSFPIDVSDGAAFVNAMPSPLWLENTASSSTGSGAFRGIFGSASSRQDFTKGLTIKGGFYLKDQGFEADYTGLSVEGFVGVDPGSLESFRIPATLSLEKVTAARVTAGADRPANLSGSHFSVPLEFAPDSHALVAVTGEYQPATAGAGVSFSPDSTLHLSFGDSAIPSGTYPVIAGVSVLPDVLPRIAGHLAPIETVEWTIQNGALAVRVTMTGSVDALVWRPDGNGAEGSLAWSAEAANWEGVGGGGKSGFTPGASALFDGNEAFLGPRIEVAEGMVPGSVTFSALADYVLAGARLGGAGSFFKDGTGTLTLDGAGVEARQIHVAGGILKLGENAQEKALGDVRIPVKVSGSGTVDINYCVEAQQDFSRNNLTYRKVFQIEGDGMEGQGALVNNGLYGGYNAFGKIELTGDATIGGTARFDLRPLAGSDALQSRPLITGPEQVLTVKNSVGVSLVDTDVNLKKIVVAENSLLRPQGNTPLTLQEGIDLSGGALYAYNWSQSSSSPLRAVSGTSRLVGESGNTTLRNSLTIESGAVLELSGNTFHVYGSITNKGTLRVTGGSKCFYGPISGSTPIEVTGGQFNYGYNTEGWPTFEQSPEFLLNGGMLRFMPPDARKIENLKVGGRSPVHFLANTLDGELELRNSKIDIEDWISISNPWNYGNLVLGEGCEVRSRGLGLGDVGSNPKSSLVRLMPGSRLEVNGSTRVGHWASSSRSYQHMLSVEGGSYINTNSITVIGWSCPYADLRMGGGRMDVEGIKLRQTRDVGSGNSQRTCSEHFVMSGGELVMGGSGITSSRTFFNDETGVYLNGGSISNRVPWGTTGYLNLAFAGDPVVWDLGESLVNFAAALQGDGEVTLRGNAAFNSSPDNNGLFYGAGTVRGHWTVGNRGGNALRNAAAFTEGLSLDEDVQVRVDIPGSGYARMDIYGEVSARECEAQAKYPRYLDRGMAFAHLNGIAWENTSYLYTGEFYVSAEEAGTWTFAESYDDEVYLKVDGVEVLNDEKWNTSTRGEIELDEGWHLFRLALKQGTGGSGPLDTKWVEKQMGVGWSSRPTASTAASEYTPFSPEYLPIRPDVTEEDRLQIAGNSFYWSRQPGTPSDWTTMDTWETTVVTNSMKGISSKTWAPGTMAVNRFKGWFYVDESKAGRWTFWGSYDDYCLVMVDGFDTRLDGNHTMYALRPLDMTVGWHRFEVRTSDKGGQWGPWRTSQGAALQYQVDKGTWYAFDESTLSFRASLALPNTEYGFIGGLLELKDGSLLTNEAVSGRTPCAITGTLRGSGTLAGGFVLATNAVWEIRADARELTEKVAFGEGADPDALKDLGRVRVFFSEKPVRTTYEVSAALGLEKGVGPDGTSLPSVEVVATDPTGTVSYPFRAAVRGGTFILVNQTPPGTIMILR